MQVSFNCVRVQIILRAVALRPRFFELNHKKVNTIVPLSVATRQPRYFHVFVLQ